MAALGNQVAEMYPERKRLFFSASLHFKKTPRPETSSLKEMCEVSCVYRTPEKPGHFTSYIVFLLGSEDLL